jgi:hypothetical protein
MVYALDQVRQAFRVVIENTFGYSSTLLSSARSMSP